MLILFRGRGGIVIKNIIIGILLIALFFTLVIIYNYNQQPTTKDVFDITKNWSPPTEEVYLVKQIDREWLTIFRNQQSIILGELKKDWFGLWDIRNDMFISTYYPPEKDDQVTWGAGGIEAKEIAYYFGQVLDSNIQKVTIKTTQNIYEDIPLIVSNGNRFFFKKVNGNMVMPIHIRGFSKSGELIFSTLSELPNK